MEIYQSFPIKEPVEHYRGDFVERHYDLADGDGVNNTPWDLAGYSARLQVRDLHDRLLLQLVSPSGISLNSPTGRVSWFVGPGPSGTIPPGRHFYDLELVAPDGKVITILSGVWFTSPDVTRV